MTAFPNLSSLNLSPTQTVIFGELRSVHPAPLSTEDIISRVYRSAKGPPLSATTTVQTAISGIRKALDGTGWQIPKARPHPGRAGLYRLEKVAAGKR
ncbi:MAG: hypothetical protein PS018_03270 [bacterium]|nr:hypothetical protein [bacterium]